MQTILEIYIKFDGNHFIRRTTEDVYYESINMGRFYVEIFTSIIEFYTVYIRKRFFGKVVKITYKFFNDQNMLYILYNKLPRCNTILSLKIKSKYLSKIIITPARSCHQYSKC